MPSASYALISVDTLRGNQIIALYDSIADITQWSFQPANSGSMQLLDFQSTACATPCASTGACASNGTCVCQAGYTGTTCSEF